MNETVTEPAHERMSYLSMAVRWTVLALLIASAIGLFAAYGDRLSLSHLAEREAGLRAWHRAHPVLIYVAAFAIYVVVTALSLPGATAMTLLLGWYFGFWRALIIVSFASTTGATTAFLTSRYLFRDLVQRHFGESLQQFNDALRREGAFYLILLRLTPAAPFFIINLVMGLTPLRARTFWWASQVGMLPVSSLFVYAASQMPDLQTLAEQGARGILSPQLIAAFLLIGLSPFAIKKIVNRIRPKTKNSPSDH